MLYKEIFLKKSSWRVQGKFDSEIKKTGGAAYELWAEDARRVERDVAFSSGIPYHAGES